MNEPTKADWVNFKASNVEVIIRSKIQIECAERIIKLCEMKIADFPPEKEIPPKLPAGIN